MAVYQPNAALGNAKSLVTLGEAGEIMTFFFPHIDFAQNVQEGMPAVYVGLPGRGQLAWTYQDCWRKRQYYVPRRNMLVTELTALDAGLQLTITDLVCPQRDVLVRRFVLRNIGAQPRVGTLLQYLWLRLGETARKNSARRLDDKEAVIQYWRDICFALGGDWPDGIQIGKAHGDNSAKRDMEDGRLNNQREELGDVDTACAWNFSLAPGEEYACLFLISAARREAAALAQLAEAKAAGYATLYEQADAWWDRWLSAVKEIRLPEPFAEIYYRSLLGIRLLYDEEYGSVLAAPEFDPSFERCGGYGFVWPRDAAAVLLALEEVGLPAMVERFFEWARATQRPEGYWEQRYWANGEVAPGWSNALDALQIDQIGAVVQAMGEHAARLAPRERSAFIERYWPVAERAVAYLSGTLGANGLHAQAFDLWEKFRGSFTYSNASIFAALRTAAAWAAARGDGARAERWLAAAARIKAALLAQCWNGEYFARGFTAEGKLDCQVDSSMLGLVDPFPLLSLQAPAERAMVEQMVRTIRACLTKQLPEGDGILRHEGDDYEGGSAGGVNTLWLARVLLRLALAYRTTDPAKSAACTATAEQYLRVVIARGTSTGLLPELIGSDTTPRWAVPHAWAMASFVQCALLLEEVRGGGEREKGRKGEGEKGSV